MRGLEDQTGILVRRDLNVNLILDFQEFCEISDVALLCFTFAENADLEWRSRFRFLQRQRIGVDLMRYGLHVDFHRLSLDRRLKIDV